MADVVVHYEGGLRCHVTHPGNGAVLVLDASQELGGRGENFSPSDLLSVSLGGCVLSIMAMAGASPGWSWRARRRPWPRRWVTPAPDHDTGRDGRVPGRYDTAQRKRLEAAAAACPVHAVLGIDAPITIVWDED